MRLVVGSYSKKFVDWVTPVTFLSRVVSCKNINRRGVWSFLRLGSVSLSLALLAPYPLRADIAGLMTPSLPNVSSGGYAWSTWDYLTTPYLYSLLEKNAVSAIITEQILEEGSKIAFAAKYNIPTPTFDIPLFFALTLENAGSVELLARESADPTAVKAIESDVPYHQFVFGTSYGKFGLGVLIQIGRQTVRKTVGSQEEATVLEYSKPSSSEFRKRFDGYGFEFGYINATNPSEGYAAVGSFLYKQYGGTSEAFDGMEGLVFRDSRPFIKNQGASALAGSTLGEGSTRNELEAHFLGWYHLTKLLNVGANFVVSVPFSSSGYTLGQMNSSQVLSTKAIDQAIERDTSTVSGYFVNPVLFMDIDFPIQSDLFANKIAGYFRLTPAFNYAREKEYLSRYRYSNDAEKRRETLSFSGETILIDLSIKMAVAVGSNKEFEIYVGWIPSIVIYENSYSLFDANSDGTFEAGEGDKEAGKTVKLGQFAVRPKGGVGSPQYALGFSYRPYESAALHFNFISESRHIKLGQVNLGVDYTF